MVSTRQQARKAAAALGLAAACICSNNGAVVDAFYTPGGSSSSSSNTPLGFAPPPQAQPWLTRSLASHRPTSSTHATGRGSRRYVRERSGLESGLRSVRAAAGDAGPAGGWGSRERSSRSGRSRGKLSMVPAEDSGSASAAVSQCRMSSCFWFVVVGCEVDAVPCRSKREEIAGGGQDVRS